MAGLGEALMRFIRGLLAALVVVAVAGGVMLTLESSAPAGGRINQARGPGVVLLLAADERASLAFTESTAVDVAFDPLLVAASPLSPAAFTSPDRRNSEADEALAGRFGRSLAAGRTTSGEIPVTVIRTAALDSALEVSDLVDADRDGVDDDGKVTVQAGDGSSACVTLGARRTLARSLGATVDADGVGLGGISWEPTGPCGRTAHPIGSAIEVGTTPGAYGGSADGDVCDAGMLGSLLLRDEALAAAWGAPFGVAASDVTTYVETLTPVVLLGDTAVTEYGRDGSAVVSRQSILERGTAILVDRLGAPAVRCASGNPLRVAQAYPVDVTLEGEGWPGFSLDRVVRMPAGDRLVGQLVLVDVRTGLPVVREVGSAGSHNRLAGSILASG